MGEEYGVLCSLEVRRGEVGHGVSMIKVCGAAGADETPEIDVRE